MFTGIVTLATIERIRFVGKDAQITVTPQTMFTHLERGESIAVNGVCLTVETFTNKDFTAFASAETLAVTTLNKLATGQRVNIERALAVGDRLGGHIVSGHVDCTATVSSIVSVGHSQRIRIQFPEQFAPQVIAKGSVALDGISLTINECGNNFLEINAIPETQVATTIQDWKAGHVINFETDIIGKYIQHNMRFSQAQEKTGITLDFLQENGF